MRNRKVKALTALHARIVSAEAAGVPLREQAGLRNCCRDVEAQIHAERGHRMPATGPETYAQRAERLARFKKLCAGQL